MAVYILADIHGMYDKFIRMLDKINMTDEDILYVLGDMVDRGPHPIKVVQCKSFNRRKSPLVI